jgi:hypothetical protein
MHKKYFEDYRLLGHSAVRHHPMIEAIRSPETSVYFNKTIRRYISEGYQLHG